MTISLPDYRGRRSRHCHRPDGLIWFAWLSIAAFIVLLPVGCGRKGPPIPPEGLQLPPTVTDLSGEVDGGMLNLKWTVPAPTEKNMLLAAGFIVLVDEERSGEPCPNCPPNYERAGELRVLGRLEIAAGSQSMQYQYPVESGYHYRVVVVSIADDGTAGPESNTIHLSP